MALLAVIAVAGSVLYQAAARERDYRLLLARADAALAEDQTFGAIEDYSGAIALRPDSMLAHLRRGQTYRRRGDLDAAARDFRTAASLDPSAPRPLEEWGDVLYEQRWYKRAIDAYEARLRVDDRSPTVTYKLALARYRDGNIDGALAASTAATRMDDQLGDAHYLRGVCLRDKDLPTQALAALEAAVARAPGLIAAREELADLYAALGRRDNELEQLQLVAGLDSARLERRVAVALAHARGGHADLAVLTLSNVLEQVPNQPIIYGALGRVWLDIARTRPDRPDALGKALEALERAAFATGASSEMMTLYGHALLLNNQAEVAERVLQQATERFPVEPDAFAQYADVAERLNHLDAARRALITYSALVGDDREYPPRATKIGVLSLRVNDAPAAVAWLRRAATVAPEDVRVLAPLADALLRMNDRDQAQATIARGLQLDPANAQLLALARRAR